MILFSTAWCPSCKAARAFLQSRGVRFVELDVEKSQQAAQQYSAVVQRFGLKRGAVPVIVVNGKAFQGFSRPQIESALAQAKPG